MRKVLRVLMAWTVLSALLAPLVGRVLRARQGPPAPPDLSDLPGFRVRPDQPVRPDRWAPRVLPDHLEAWVNRDRPEIPEHLAVRVRRDRPVPLERLVPRVRKVT